MAYWYDGAALAATRSPVIALFWCLIKFTTTTTTTSSTIIFGIPKEINHPLTSSFASSLICPNLIICRKLLPIEN